MFRITTLAVALLLLGQGLLSAQQANFSVAAQPRAEAASTVSLLSEAAQAELQQVNNSVWSRLGRQALFTAGFSLVGSGFGYFASQVAYSDWDKANNSTFASERRAFSLTGAAIGAVVGFALGARDTGPMESRIALHQELAGGDLLLGVELENSHAQTAYEAIQRLRPNWLLTRGTQHISGAATGTSNGRETTITPGLPTIKVYVDNAFMGDLDTLRTLPIATVRSIRRLDPAAATTRWGSGHTYGAIVIETVQR